MMVSFTPRLKAFQKLKEISPGKCGWLRLFHPIQQRFVCTLHLPPPSPFLSPSFSVTCNSREDGNGADPPQLSPARRKERRGRERRRGREAVRWIEGGRKGCGTRGFVGGMESISKLQATLFDPLSPPPSRHSPAAFSRLLPSGKATPPARLAPSVSLSISPARSLSGDSVLASNTDIEQSPFSLKPSSHQE